MTHGEMAALAVAVLVPLIGFHWRTWWKIDKLVTRVGVEHEMLVSDYCERKGIDLEDLPTRHRVKSWDS